MNISQRLKPTIALIKNVSMQLFTAFHFKQSKNIHQSLGNKDFREVEFFPPINGMSAY